jgi:hypothetical protein
MIQEINGQLTFTYACPKNNYNKLIKVKIKLSLLGILMGIFLLPNIAFLSTITPEKLIDLTNQERNLNGLYPLTANQLLTKAAILKANAIIETNTFKHTINDKKFSSWIQDAGYNYSYVGENLAIDFVNSESVIEAWKESPLHKKNLLSPYYQEIGIATIAGKFQSQDTIVVVQIFGAPAISSIAPSAQNLGSQLMNAKSALPEINLPNYQPLQTENLLNNIVINQELLPLYNNKLVLPEEINQTDLVNTFVIQPNFQKTINNFIIIFMSLYLTYIIIFLFYYSFLKINKSVSA